MKALIIDDMKERHVFLTQEYKEAFKEIVSAYSYDGAVELINNSDFDFISFDHDLNDFKDGRERTGATVAMYMANNSITTSEVRVHSSNPVGAANIISILKSGDVCHKCYYEPFSFKKNK